MIHVECEHCANVFDVGETLAGGIANCPRCEKATPVEGLRDPWFRLVQVLCAVGWAILTAVGWSSAGWVGALILGGGSLLVIALIYSAM